MATSARWAAIQAKVQEALADDPEAAGLLEAVFGAAIQGGAAGASTDPVTGVTPVEGGQEGIWGGEDGSVRLDVPGNEDLAEAIRAGQRPTPTQEQMERARAWTAQNPTERAYYDAAVGQIRWQQRADGPQQYRLVASYGEAQQAHAQGERPIIVGQYDRGELDDPDSEFTPEHMEALRRQQYEGPAAVFKGLRPGASRSLTDRPMLAEHKGASQPAYPGVKLKPGAQGGDLTDPRRLDRTPDWGAATRAYEALQNRGEPDGGEYEDDPSAQERWERSPRNPVPPRWRELDAPALEQDQVERGRRQLLPVGAEAPAGDGLIPLAQVLRARFAGLLPPPGG